VANIIRPRRSRSAAAYRHQTFPWTISRSVRRCVRASVCPVHCGKMADRIRMPFGVIGRTGSGMRQVVGFGDRSTWTGTFGGELRAYHCNQWGLYGYVCDSAATRPSSQITLVRLVSVCYCTWINMVFSATPHLRQGWTEAAWRRWAVAFKAFSALVATDRRPVLPTAASVPLLKTLQATTLTSVAISDIFYLVTVLVN